MADIFVKNVAISNLFEFGRENYKMYNVIKDYYNNDNLRKSFNNLSKKTFGLNFEEWYQNGFWGENYNPYSIVKNGEVIANVSVNKTNFIWNGETKKLVQLGTVMTSEKYRKQGLIREIMKEIEHDFGDNVDGIYLFANDEVLKFYPKFGFEVAKEYQYSKLIATNNLATIKKIPMYNKNQWDKLEKAMKQSKCFGQFDMVGNSGLFLFYVTGFMQENVFYDKALDTYVIADLEDTDLFIHAIFSPKEVLIEDIIRSFGKSITKVTFGFVPKDTADFQCAKLHQEDTTLFVKGKFLVDFSEKHIMFPTLAHA